MMIQLCCLVLYGNQKYERENDEKNENQPFLQLLSTRMKFIESKYSKEVYDIMELLGGFTNFGMLNIQDVVDYVEAKGVSIPD